MGDLIVVAIVVVVAVVALSWRKIQTDGGLEASIAKDEARRKRKEVEAGYYRGGRKLTPKELAELLEVEFEERWYHDIR